MTECDGCGAEAGNLYCGHCREYLEEKWTKERGDYEETDIVGLIFWDKENKVYRVGCSCMGCPANEAGLCSLTYPSIDKIDLHEYDGDNCVRTLCG